MPIAHAPPETSVTAAEVAPRLHLRHDAHRRPAAWEARCGFLLMWTALALSGLAFALLPDAQDYFGEDDLVETLSAAAYAASALLALGLAITPAGRPRARRLLLVALLSALCLGDELSFGERLFALQMPWVYDVKFDAAHDVVEIGWAILQHHLSITAQAFVGTASVMIAGVTAWRFGPTAFRFACRSTPTTLFAQFVIMLSIAQFLDMDGVFPLDYRVIEETLELVGGLVLMLCSWSLRRPPADGALTFDRSVG